MNIHQCERACVHIEDGEQRGILLKARELDLIRQVAQGKTNAEIAYSLGKRLPTVRNQLSEVFGKFGVVSRVQLMIAAHKAGLVSLDEIDV